MTMSLTFPQPLFARIGWGMASRTPKKSKAETTADPRTFALGQEVGRLIEARKLSVDQSHVGKFIKGKKGIGLEQLANVLQVLDRVLVIEDAGDSQIPLVGTVGAHGRVAIFAGSVSMPGAYQVEADFGRFSPGDRVVIVAGEYTPGKWALVRSPDDELRLLLCEVRGGVRLLVGAEAVLYDEAKHKILGVARELIQTL